VAELPAKFRYNFNLVISEGDGSMSKELAMKLRYLGVMPQVGFVEYGFRIENKDKSVRQVILTIADDFFQKFDLKRQEAPDLCYQKILTDLDVEMTDSGSQLSVPVTALDIAHYRDLHPAKVRKTFRQNFKSSQQTDSGLSGVQ
jgi:hypothetical protein